MSGTNRLINSNAQKNGDSLSVLKSNLSDATVNVLEKTNIKNKAGDASKYTSSNNLNK